MNFGKTNVAGNLRNIKISPESIKKRSFECQNQLNQKQNQDELVKVVISFALFHMGTSTIKHYLGIVACVEHKTHNKLGIAQNTTS